MKRNTVFITAAIALLAAFVVGTLVYQVRKGDATQALAREALLASQARWAPNHTPQPELVWIELAGLGLDLERVRHDMYAPEIARIVEQDVADAKALSVNQTPEFFVNGRPMPSFGYEQLSTLVDDALAKAYP